MRKGPLSEWSYKKIVEESLPSSRGDINLRSAFMHVPEAFLASNLCSQSLVSDTHCMLGRPPGSSPFTSFAVATLAAATSHLDWQFLDDIDNPLCQGYLSFSID